MVWKTLPDERRTVLIWIGLIIQVVGLVVTGIGVRRTWREFSAEPFWDPLVQRGRRLWAWITATLRRVFKRPRTLRAEGAGTVKAVVEVRAVGRAGFRTIPSDQPFEEAISELDERTRHLLDQIADARQHYDGEFRTFRSDLGSLQDEVRRVEAELGESDRRVAISGLRLEALGLFLLAIGILLQGVALAG